MKALDLTGQRFRMLVVVEKTKEKSRRNVFMWRCRCDCGNTILLEVANIKGPKAKTSCGCIREQHGDWKERLYNVWAQMKNRCSSPGDDHYYRYGGRGISVCTEWMKYSQFKWWAILAGYREDLTIDRIDNDGNYEPGNCRWVTTKENNRNRPSTKLTPAVVSEIKRLLFAEKRGVVAVARMYGMGTTIISNINNGLAWSDINATQGAPGTISADR